MKTERKGTAPEWALDVFIVPRRTHILILTDRQTEKIAARVLSCGRSQ